MKYPYVEQHDLKDCGAACLATVCKYYGYETHFHNFISMTKTDLNGTSIFNLVQAATKLGFESHALEATFNDLIDNHDKNMIKFPLIAHTFSKGIAHFIVVYKIKNGKIVVADPSYGIIKYTYKEFEEIWTGYLVSLDPKDDFVCKKDTVKVFSYFINILKPNKYFLIGIMLLTLTLSVFELVSAYSFQLLVNEVLEIIELDEGIIQDDDHDHSNMYNEIVDEEDDQNTTSLIDIGNTFFINMSYLINKHLNTWQRISVWLCILYLISYFIKFLREVLIVKIVNKIDYSLISNYINKLFVLPKEVFSLYTNGDIISRFSDIFKIRQAVTGVALSFLTDALMACIIGTFMYSISPKLFVISCLIIVIYTFIFVLYKEPIQRTNRYLMEREARVISYLKEIIEGIEVIKSFNYQDVSKAQYMKKTASLIRVNYKSELLYTSQSTLVGVVSSVSNVLIIIMGINECLKNDLRIELLVTYYILMTHFFDSVTNLLNLQPLVQAALVSLERLETLFYERIENNHIDKHLTIKNGNISINHLRFSYNNKLILDDVNIQLNSGEQITIVGESGSGKTTLAKLILGIYEFDEGSILIDSCSIKNLDKNMISKGISYVSQENFLFNDSIKNNLLMGNTEITEESFFNICQNCMIDEFVKELPYGYDTVLEENGRNLSVGQRQRLCIARALLKNTNILILDEATSNIDSDSRRKLYSLLESINGKVTCIIITHDFSFINPNNKIYKLELGKINEVEYDDLVANRQQ